MQTTDILLCIILFFLICEALLMIKQKMSSKNSAERFTVKKSQDNQIYNNATPVQKSIPEPVDNLESQPQEVHGIHRLPTIIHHLTDPYVKFYDHDNYGGNEWVFGAGEYRLEHLVARGLQMNQISSFILGPRTTIDLYYSDNFQGHLNDGENTSHTSFNHCSNNEKGTPDLAKKGWNRQTVSL